MSDFDNSIDYEMDPMTIELISDYQSGSDVLNYEMAAATAVENLVEKVTLLDDYTKGIVIIDLLTLSDCLSQALTLMQLPKLGDEEK